MNDKVEKTEGTAGEIVLYQPDEMVNIEVKLDVEHNTVWLNTMQMSQLFNREDSNIRRHVGNIFREGELDKGNNVRFLHVIGVKKPVPHLRFIRDIARRRNWISRSTILSTSQSSVCSCHIRFTTAI